MTCGMISASDPEKIKVADSRLIPRRVAYRHPWRCMWYLLLSHQPNIMGALKALPASSTFVSSFRCRQHRYQPRSLPAVISRRSPKSSKKLI